MKTVVILSGGLDSTVLLYSRLQARDEVVALSVDYGQRHKAEIAAARRICAVTGVYHIIIDLSILRVVMKGSSQTDAQVPVPHGHYAEESMKKTVVPNRNMILLSIAGAAAVSEGADAIAYAAHAGDHTIYPDCRPAFTEAMEKAFAIANWKPIVLMRPFIEMTKAEIVTLGEALGAPFALTYSCYEGELNIHCGKCGTCVERREAFRNANITDPTNYRA